MKTALVLAFALLFGCARAVGTSPSDSASDGGTPAPGSATAGIDGIADPFNGSFLISVGPDDSDIRIGFTADGINGSFGRVLAGGFSPSIDMFSQLPITRGTAIHYDPGEDYHAIATNHGSVTLSANAVSAQQAGTYVVTFFDLAIDASGAFTAEVHGVNTDRVDATTQTVRPGTAFVIHLHGTVGGGCATRLQPGDPSSPVVPDPARSRPTCRAVLGPPG